MNEYNKTETDSQLWRTNFAYQWVEERGKRHDRGKGFRG